jgi:hypothetical protein
MPLKQFELSKEARKRRASFKVFFCSALLGTSAGLLTRLFGSSPLALETPSGLATLAAMTSLILLIVVTVFYAMKTVLAPDEIHRILEVYLVYSKDKGSFVPITNRWAFVMQSSVKLRSVFEKESEPVKILRGNDIDAVQKLTADLVTYELLDKLATEYNLGWAPKLRYMGVSYGRFSFKTDEEGGKAHSVHYSDIPEELRSNNLFLRLAGESVMAFGTFKFSVPPKTTFKWADNAAKGQQVLSLSNKYCRIELAVSRAHWMVGLSPIWGKFVAARDKNREESFGYLQEHYAHTVIEIGLSARFNWFWSLVGSSNDYFDWVEDIFDRLDDFFSFEKEYHALEKTHEKFVLD